MVVVSIGTAVQFLDLTARWHSVLEDCYCCSFNCEVLDQYHFVMTKSCMTGPRRYTHSTLRCPKIITCMHAGKKPLAMLELKLIMCLVIILKE